MPKPREATGAAGGVAGCLALYLVWSSSAYFSTGGANAGADGVLRALPMPQPLGNGPDRGGFIAPVIGCLNLARYLRGTTLISPERLLMATVGREGGRGGGRTHDSR